jgi:diadenosine tetraphosphate (Ap4A) HIT family hydrolase
MCKNFNDDDLGVMDMTNPISLKVRQIFPRVPAELEHLYVVLQMYDLNMPHVIVVSPSRTMFHRSLLTPL